MLRAMIVTLLVLDAATAFAADRSVHRAHGRAGARPTCLVEVLHSELLPWGPIFQHIVRERLLITPRGQVPFEAVVQRLAPWQEPPPRRGQRRRMACDAVALNAVAFYE